MAQNIVIELNANYKQFESALDAMTAKVESTASKMDKAFSFSGSAEKSIKNTSNAVRSLGQDLKNISMIAAGNMIADGFEKALGKIKQVGQEIYSTTARMQSLEMGMKSLVTSDLVKTGKVKDYTEAMGQAEAETKKLMDWFKELSMKSPYELMEVMESFKQNANMGQSVETAKKTTEAILALGAGLGMGQAEMKRFSAALAQTGATGRITAMDLRQFANNGFGMDKMNQIFSILSEKYKIVIADNNDFNKAVAEGKITTDDFFEALNTYALDNYGNAVDAMASTIEGLKSSLGDIKVSAINDLFLEASKTVSKTLAPYVEYLMKMITGGDFTKWGQDINNWVQGILGPFQKLGETLQNGMLTSAINNLKDFFSGKSLNLGGFKAFLEEIGGAEFADKWIQKLLVIKAYFDKFLENKGVIIDALKGIGIAFAAAFAVTKLATFIGLITQLFNPLTALVAIGAALGIAWNKNLLGIQDATKACIDYIKGLIAIGQTDGIGAVFEKIKTDILGKIDELKAQVPERVKNIFSGIADIAMDVVHTFGDIFGKMKDNVLKSFSGIKEEVSSKISGLVETLQPFKDILLAVIDLLGMLGTAAVGIVVSTGVLMVGAINGLLKGIDEIVGAIMSGIDFILSLIRLPFDLIVNLGGIIIGIVQGDGDLIDKCASNIVERLKHTWNAFKDFWIELWGFFKEYVSGIWEVIKSVVDGVDLSESIGKIFGEEVVQKVEDFKTKVVNIIDDIIAAWLKMTGTLNGHTVNIKVGNERRDISGAAYDAFLKQNTIDEASYTTAHRDSLSANKRQGSSRDTWLQNQWKQNEFAYTSWFGDFDSYVKAVNESYELSYEDMMSKNLETFYREASNEIIRYHNEVQGNGMHGYDLQNAVNAFIDENYAWAKEDAYMAERLEKMNANIEKSISIYEKNTDAVETNTESNKDSTKESKTVADVVKESTDKVNGWNFKSELSEETYDVNATEEYVEMIKGLRDFMQDSMPNLLEDMKVNLKDGSTTSTKQLEYAVHWMETYTKNKDKYSEADYIKYMTSAITHSGLPQEMQDAMINAFNTEGVDADFVATYSNLLINGINEAGLRVAQSVETATSEDTEKSTFGSNWNYSFAKAMSDEYGKYVGSRETEILKEMGMTAAQAFALANSKEKSDVEYYEAERAKAMENLGITMEKWYKAEMVTGQNQSAENWMQSLLSSFETNLGTTFDGLKTVTADNWAEARDFLTSMDTWETFAETVAFGGAGVTEDYMMTGLEDMMSSVGYSNEQIQNTMESLQLTMKDMDSEQKLSWLKFLISGVDTTIGDFAEANDKGLKAVDSSVNKLQGNPNRRNTGVAEAFDEIIGKYNSSTGIDKDLFGYQLQAMLDATGIGNFETGEGRLNLVDLMNGQLNNDTYRAAVAAMNDGNYNKAIYDAMFESYTQTYIKALQENQATLDEYGNAVGKLDLTGKTGENGESGISGLLGILFGDPTLYQGLTEVLTPDVVSSLQSLLTTTIDDAALEAWTSFTGALTSMKDSVAEIMKNISGGEEGDAGSAFADGLRKMGESAVEVTPQLQNQLNPELELMQKYLDNAMYFITKLIETWTEGAWEQAVKAFVEFTAQATGACKQLATEAGTAASKFDAWAGAIWAVINAYKQLEKLLEKKGGKAPVKTTVGGITIGDNPSLKSGGGGLFPYQTAIVGEHGPEIIRTGSSRLNVFTNTQLMDEIAHTRHALNMLSSSAEAVYANRMMAGMGNSYSDNHSQNFNASFGTVIGDKAFEDMMEDKMRKFWRREMRLAS